MSPIRRSPRGGNARGTALIEFALVFPFLLVLTLGVVDLSRAFFVKNMLYQAAREGARALVVSAPSDTASIYPRIRQVASAAGVPVKDIIFFGPVDGMQTVTVTTDFKWLFPDLFRWFGATYTNPVKLRGVAVMRKESP